MYSYILIIFVSTSFSSQSGSAGISQEFYSKDACMTAGSALVNDTIQKGNRVLTWGCFQKNKEI